MIERRAFSKSSTTDSTDIPAATYPAGCAVAGRYCRFCETHTKMSANHRETGTRHTVR